MKHLMLGAILAALILPGAAAAQFRLSQLQGSYAGTGTYTEGVSSAQMKCRLALAGSDAALRLTGRCASSLGGAEEFNADIIRLQSGEIVVRDPAGADPQTGIAELRGFPGADGFTVQGASGRNLGVLTIRDNGNGTLSLWTERKWSGNRSTSVITMGRR